MNLLIQVLVLMTLVNCVHSHEGEHGQTDNIGRYGQGMTRNPMETTTKSVKPKAQEEMPESEIRMGYGILYQAYGKLLHGLNKFHLVVGLELPKFKFHLDRPIIHFNDYQEHCKNLAVVDYILVLCLEVWPLYLHYRYQEVWFQYKIKEKLCSDLPAILNGYQPPTELCNLELPPLKDVDPTQYYGIISVHPVYGTYGNLQTLNSTMLQNAFLEMKDKRNLTLDNEARQQRAQGSRFTYQTGNRHKRFVTTLLTLAFDGFKTYISHKADKKLIKGMKIIRKNQKIMNKRITTVENDMLALAQATLHDLNELQNQLENTNTRTDYLANRLINAETNLQKVADKTNDNWLAIEYLALVLGQIFPNLERGLSQYEHILHELDVLIDAIDNLSNGLLSPSVIRPGDLQIMIGELELILRKEFPQYTLALSLAELYYNIPMIKFMFLGNMLGVHIPWFVQHHTQKALDLYHLQTVPVPYHINQELIEDQSKGNHEMDQSYTQLQPKHDLLAMSYSTYIPLDHVEMQNCFKFGNIYFCEQSFITHHSTGHTCESAIFYNLKIAIIKTLCVFTYYATLNPDPVVLDSGSQLLLANMPTPWTFFCIHEDQIPNDIQGAKYALIQKSDLCLCSITAGSLYLHENIGSCADKKNSHVKMNLYFTINQAAYLYFPEMVPDLNLKFDVILNKARKSTLTNVQLLTAEDTDVVKHKPRPMMLPSAMRSVKQNHTMFNSKGDKALAIDDVSKWITWENRAMSFIFFGSILSIISLIIILFLWIFYYKLKIKFFSTLKDKITTKASKFPRFLTNTFGKFRNSKKGIRPLNRPVKYNVKTRSVTIRPPIPPIPTCSRIENPMIDNSSLSVQAEINRIETKETAHQLSGMDNLGLDISQIPPPSETE